ncbi:MAG: hypothetical protein HY774_25580 [Acidobacteria bacterium]|nr:hypothetical protein [Acidobacteriota bacterium]
MPENRKDQDQFRNESIEFLISLANLAKGTNIKDRLAARFVQRMGLKKGDQIAGSEGVVLNEPLDDNYVISTGLETPLHLRAFLEGEGSPEEINKLLKSSVYCSLRLWLYFEDNSSGDATLGITLCKHNKEWKILDILVAEN